MELWLRVVYHSFGQKYSHSNQFVEREWESENREERRRVVERKELKIAVRKAKLQ